MNRIIITALLLCATHTGFAQLKRFSFTESKMGSPFTIIMFCNDSLQAGNLARQCFALVDSFVFIFSDYIDSSELSKLSAANEKPVSVSPAMLEILLLSKTAFDKSDGAFDITMGPLVKMWRLVKKTNQWPTAEEVQAKKKLTGFNKMILDTVHKKLTLLQPGMQLDLGGIAQGYIAGKIMDYLRSQNVNHALVNVSGDIVMSQAPPGTKGWRVGINLPETKEELLPGYLFMQNRAVTSSGDVYQYIEHNGKRYSHILDPRAGYGVTSQRNVTVIAKDAVTADWLATACSILPVGKAKRLAKKMNAELLIGTIKKGKFVFKATRGFESYWKKDPS